MEIIDYARAAYKSADKYLKYARENKQSREIINISSIEKLGNNKFRLYTTKKAPYMDSVEIVIMSGTSALEYEPWELKIVDFSETKGYITIIAASLRCMQAIVAAKPSDITLVSDLTFLIENVKNWYIKYHDDIAYPCLPNIQVNEKLFPTSISDEQKQAVFTALESAVSYVWGAPGTGKTQIVLANSVLQHIKIHDCVLLVAPTNNALEQSLRGLIKVLNNNKISLKKIIRFGRATSEFVTKYPEICESGYYDTLISDMKRDLAELQNMLEKQNLFDRIMSAYQSFKQMSGYYVQNKQELDKLLQEISSAENHKNQIQTKITNQDELIKSTERDLELLLEKEKSQQRYLLVSSSYKEYDQIIRQCNRSIDKIRSELNKAEQAYYNAVQNESSLRTELEKERSELDAILSERYALSGKIKCLFSKKVKAKFANDICAHQENINAIKAKNEDAIIILNQWKEALSELNARAKEAKAARDNHPRIIEISRTVFENTLSYNELCEALADELKKFKRFVVDNNISQKIEKKRKLLSDSQNERIILEQSSHGLDDEIVSLNAQALNLRGSISRFETEIKNLFNDTFGFTLPYDEIIDQFEKAVSEFSDFQRIDNLESKVAHKKQELEKVVLELKNITDQKQVIACTIDYAIRHFEEIRQIVISHVFVDEAAYCPLIKAAVVFSFNVPVTLLGDHMQLPPICEMDRVGILSNGEYNLIFLWDMSAIYFPAIFNDTVTIETMFEDYASGSIELPQDSMAITFLTHTYRFSDKLAAVLDKYVYKQGFRGEANKKINITVVNVPRTSSETKPYESIAEAQAIKKYIEKYAPEDYAILVPYKNQRSNVERAIKLPPGKIMTIHGSQGREWDTVIIGVTDGRRKWFMNSNNKKSNGLLIVNTAVSRARKHIVLVLDYDCWEDSTNQLISEIANIHTELISG